MSLYDENAEILRTMEAGGSDLGPARRIDFSHVFPDRESANAFARSIESEGFSTTVEYVGREGPWDVTAFKEMVPNCENITSTEARLDTLARLYQGRADGWGFFRT